MSLAKQIASKMLSKKGEPKPCRCSPNPFQCGTSCRCVGCGCVGKKSGGAVAPARSQVHRGTALPRRATVPREPDLAEVLQAQPRPQVHEVPPAVLKPGWTGSCRAICAVTGRRCRLPAHPGTAHAHERGQFFRAAAPDQITFTAREQLDRAATSRHSSTMSTEAL